MQELPQRSQKSAYLDFIRVLATLAVIILHTTCTYYNNPANSAASLWHILGYVTELSRIGVPLFFMISGYLLLNKDIVNIGGFYKKRFAKVGIPFIIYDIFYYFYMNITAGSAVSLKGFFNDLTVQGSCYHLWFVYSILFIYLLMPFLQMIVKNIGKRGLFLFLLLVIFQSTLRPFINTVFGGKIYFYLTDDGFTGYIGYVILGYILGKYDFGKWETAVIYIFGLLFFIITPIFSMKSVSKGGEFLFSGGYSLNHYIEAAAVFLFCKRHTVKPCKMISALSAVSFSTYLIHVFVLEELKRIPLNLSPSALIVFLSFSTIILSFFWGFAERFFIKMFKRVVSSKS